MRVLLGGYLGPDDGDLLHALEAAGHEVTRALDRDGLVGCALSPDTGIVLLDRDLSKDDWVEDLAAIRLARPSLPVVLLSDECDAASRVEALDRGAGDYVTRPFSFDELEARIRARLRESEMAGGSILTAADLRLNQITREAVRCDRVVQLSQRECDLLAFLMRRAGTVCSRREILAVVWSYDHDPETNVVQVYVGYLRRRLSVPGSPVPIETVRSLGYRLAIAG